MKRLFVFCFSCAFFLCSQIRRLYPRMIGRREPGTCVVLQYHAIPVEQRTKFARQMEVVQRYATPVSADSMARLAMSRHHVAVTFDDGLTSFVENALPELEKRNIPAVVFVVVGRLGSVPAWARYFSDSAWTSGPSIASAERMLTAEQLRELDGRVTIGSHSLTHQMLPELDQAEAMREIEGSRQQLEAILGNRVTLFSLPYGAFAKDVLLYCKHAGYERVFTVEPKLAFSDPQEFVSGRVSVDPTDWALEFRLKLTGYYRWLPYAVGAKRMLFRTLGFGSHRKRHRGRAEM